MDSKNSKIALNAWCHGLLFAVLQFGEFLLLSLFFSSSALTWLEVSLAWLAGSALGFTTGSTMSLRSQLAMQTGAFTALALLLWLVPVSDWLLPVYGCCVCVTAVGVGHFFRRSTGASRVDVLLWRENDGFVVGIPLVFTVYLTWGRHGLYTLVLMAVMAALAAPGNDPAEVI